MAWAAASGAADPLAAYRDLPQQIARLTSNATQVGWQPVLEATVDPLKPFWGTPTQVVEEVERPADAAVGKVSVTAVKVGEHQVLGFDAHKAEAAFLSVGSKLKGDLAIEIVCRSVGERVCDLSLLLDGMAKGPGFQFGGYDNRRNLLWADDADGNWKYPVELPVERLIVKDQWHTVRLELVDGILSGWVDGQLLGSVPLGAAYQADRERQPLFYIYDGRAEIKRLALYKLKEPAAGKAREPIGPKIEALIALLDHEEFKVRTESQQILKALGPRAFKPLRAALASGSIEQQVRIRELLGEPSAEP